MTKKKVCFGASIISLFPSFFLTSCDASGEVSSVYVSFYPLYEFVSCIVGDVYPVVNITPPGGEPHEQELSVKTLKGISGAKAVFVNGLGLEEWIDDVPSYLSDKIFTVTNDVDPRYEDGTIDPHVWLNPLNAIKMVESACETLMEIDEENEDVFRLNADSLIERLMALDSELMASAEPLAQKTICVSHAAFGYLTDRYGFTQLAINGLSPEEEPTSSGIALIIEAVSIYGISTVFYEENVSSKIAETIAKETGCQTDTLNPIETLSEEEMGNEDYFSLQRENMAKIVKASEGA